jgi:hypothetical protein
LQKQYNGDCLLIDSIFESGNLLQADRIDSSDYNLYMQVDTNTKGHQQWFHFRVQNTKANKKYTFHIMNFTKPGLTGGQGYRKQEFKQRVVFKGKGHTDWQSVASEKLSFVKTQVARRRKDVMMAGQDSD